MLRRVLIVFLLGLAGLGTVGPGAASELDFRSLQDGSQAFKDLPGVKTPEELKAAQRPVECHSQFRPEDPIFPSNDRLGKKLVYSCTDGVVTIQNDAPPRSIERMQRGLNW